MSSKAVQSNKRKRKAYYRKCASVSARRARLDSKSSTNDCNSIPRQLQSDMTGYLVTFNQNARLAQMEAFRMLNQTLSEALGQELSENIILNNHNDDDDDDDDGNDGKLKKAAVDEDDIYSQLRKENCPELTKKFAFYGLKTSVNNSLFILHHTDKICVSELTKRLYNRLLNASSSESRHVLRLMPVTATCYSKLEQIQTHIGRLWSEFLTNHKTRFESKTFMILFKARNFDCLQREDVIEAVISTIRSIDTDWTGDLINPQVVVCINVFCKITCLSVLEDYVKYCKYNIAELGLTSNSVECC